MSYATVDDLIARYGMDAYAQTFERDGGIDEPAAVQALTDASAEIDAYLSGRYTLPLATVPGLLPLVCIDIAYYRGAMHAGIMTDEKRQRYEDHIRLLERIADGRVKLGAGDPGQSSDGGAVFSAGTRRITRGSMSGGF